MRDCLISNAKLADSQPVSGQLLYCNHVDVDGEGMFALLANTILKAAFHRTGSIE